ncbi:hypothetical protein SAY87_013651 [Trapa incisa]|uniref:Uncharacterized protein n=1 Tax=Trapa incisa TaxID=236973 RepID=A0AAN7KGM9_9MYRT|nr:hypothetical protein SAY87_013651 [Trapa incisa]
MLEAPIGRINPFESAVQEWRQRAVSSEAKVTELQLKVSMLRDKVDSLNKTLRTESMKRARHPQAPLVLSSQDEAGKRVLICSLEENGNNHLDGTDAGLIGGGKYLHRQQNLAVSSLRYGNSTTKQNHAKAMFALNFASTLSLGKQIDFRVTQIATTMKCATGLCVRHCYDLL